MIFEDLIGEVLGALNFEEVLCAKRHLICMWSMQPWR